jgi:hypothetical protein
MSLIFFTDISTNISKYCLLNIKALNDKRRNTKTMFFIDPGVYELAKPKNLNHEYSNFSLLHSLARSLKENEYLSIDYPCDMVARFNWDTYFNNDYERVEPNKIEEDYYITERLIQKSYFNNIIYANVPNYITTIQSAFESWISFEFEAEKLRSVWDQPHKRVIGIGNMCRIMKTNAFTDKVYNYIAENMKGKWVHIYGMPMKQIIKYVPILQKAGIVVSCDSTKWTKRIHKRFPLDKHICARKEDRDLFFTEYIKRINEQIDIKIKY